MGAPLCVPRYVFPDAKTVQVEQLIGVLPVDFFQDFLIQSYAVDFPVALDGSGMIELLVVGLQIAPVNLIEPTVFFFGEAFPGAGALDVAFGIKHAIGAEHDAILMTREELTAVFRRMAAQLAQSGGKIDMEIRHLVHPFRDGLDVFRIVGNVAALELDLRELANDVVSLLKKNVARRVFAAVGEMTSPDAVSIPSIAHSSSSRARKTPWGRWCEKRR